MKDRGFDLADDGLHRTGINEKGLFRLLDA